MVLQTKKIERDWILLTYDVSTEINDERDRFREALIKEMGALYQNDSVYLLPKKIHSINEKWLGKGERVAWKRSDMLYKIVWPVFSQSARNAASPLSVSGCSLNPRSTAGGIVATSAPASADCFT